MAIIINHPQTIKDLRFVNLRFGYGIQCSLLIHLAVVSFPLIPGSVCLLQAYRCIGRREAQTRRYFLVFQIGIKSLVEYLEGKNDTRKRIGSIRIIST